MFDKFSFAQPVPQFVPAMKANEKAALKHEFCDLAQSSTNHVIIHTILFTLRNVELKIETVKFD